MQTFNYSFSKEQSNQLSAKILQPNKILKFDPYSYFFEERKNLLKAFRSYFLIEFKP